MLRSIAYDVQLAEAIRVEVPGRDDVPLAIVPRVDLLARHDIHVTRVPDVDAGRLFGLLFAAGTAVPVAVVRLRSRVGHFVVPLGDADEHGLAVIRPRRTPVTHRPHAAGHVRRRRRIERDGAR
jgi:hypothetical protein